MDRLDPLLAPDVWRGDTLRGQLRTAKISLRLCLDKEPAASLILAGEASFHWHCLRSVGPDKSNLRLTPNQALSDAGTLESCPFLTENINDLPNKRPDQQCEVRRPAASPTNYVHVQLFYISSHVLGEI